MTEAHHTRIRCSQCQRPQRSCLCDLITPVNNVVHVHLLQHPKESQHPKGSAILLQLSLQRMSTWVGEDFPLLEQTLSNHGYQDILLYPSDDVSEPHNVPSTETSREFTSSDDNTDMQPIRLWVLDGTWRKTYKMLQLNPALLQLPRFTARAHEIGQYRIRKAPKEGQLSTLEACCHALAELEQSAEKYRALLTAFEEFNQRWMHFAQKPTA
ncbi:tRNA-uridine aminocarboxypropyltransferase [Pseudoteredinibacter isoporae]|uniref:tRNA-uridine aminocarboxypropyltransferase n=1 Tax=Pseudoteredinibacter isoporae TaxID=570281 RepID=UPI00310B6D61